MNTPEQNSPSLLPVVVPEVGAAVLQNWAEEGDLQRMDAVSARFIDSQPYLSLVMSALAQETARTDDELQRMNHALLVMYDLLMSQGRADEMNRQLGGDV